MSRRWTAGQDTTLGALWRAGYPGHLIAALIGRTVKSVWGRVDVLRRRGQPLPARDSRPAQARQVRACDHCGVWFSQRSGSHRFCTPACRRCARWQGARCRDGICALAAPRQESAPHAR